MSDSSPASTAEVLLAGVDSSYRHFPKHATPGPVLELPGVALKWYDLHRVDQPVPDDIRQMAQHHLEAESRQRQLQVQGLGFVLLHRCGEAFYFLIVNTWQNSNELWETVYYKDGEAMPGFTPFPRDGTHKPAFCVWELGVVQHEQLAWSTLLASPRDETAVRAYLDNRYAASV